MKGRGLLMYRTAIALLIAALALGIGTSLAQRPASQPQVQPAAAAPAQPATVADDDITADVTAKPDGEETPAEAPPAEAEGAAPAEKPQAVSLERQLSGIRRMTNADHQAVAERAAQRGIAARGAVNGTKAPSPSAGCANPAGVPCGTTDYFAVPNWAHTRLLNPVYNQTAVPVSLTQTGVRKFVDTLAGLGPANHSSLGLQNYLPVAMPFATLPPGVPNDADYYEIGLKDYTQAFNTDINGVSGATIAHPTQLRGYRDLNPATGVWKADSNPHYLGPVIVAKRNRAVRIKFVNELTTDLNTFIPVDRTYMGIEHKNSAGMSDGTSYSNNRATLHLHGGATPWISDGTPHQWTVPQGEYATATYKRGVSASMVPDMWFDPTTFASVAAGTPGAVNDPGPGKLTFFYSNQQSGRLMFYHDHAWGTTRLNVYAGEAAGYLLYDDVEDQMITDGILPNNSGADQTDYSALPPEQQPAAGGVYRWGIPLIIQDKSFVPPDPQLALTDPTWNWGPEGNLWFPHVYMTNQAPDNPDNSGASQYGRWDLGAWFWPNMTPADVQHWTVQCGTNNTAPPPLGWPATTQCPPTPNPSGVPEGFMDTPVINGIAYPYVELPRGVFRFRLLNAANDRNFNFSLFYAADANGNVCSSAYTGLNSLALPSTKPTSFTACTEVKMVPAVPPPAAGIPACADPNVKTGVVGQQFTSGNPATVACWPKNWPTDGRDGGVPDPLTAGPSLIQIGSEGGLLTHPAIIDPQPVGYEYNRRSIVVLNVTNTGLFLGPAERADFIVDFTQVPDDSTLILYNDSPAPVPAFDTRNDYYTNNPDQTSTGGTPTTIAGYGPNTRTVMQIHVLTSTPAQSFNLANLQNGVAGNPTAVPPVPAKDGLPQAFIKSQPPLVIPEIAYSNATVPPSTTNTFSRISNTSLTFTPLPVALVTNPGSGYTSAPVVTFTPPAGGTAAQGFALISSSGQVTDVIITDVGVGVPQTILIAPPASGTRATAVANIYASQTPQMGAKAIQELFELDYGRMNATLGTELPLTSFNTQTTIPLGYIDPPTEIINDGEYQIWKITHNGVDTHTVHFHLFNVQLINRVGWDGAIVPPDDNELGWKEAVRMHPLMDAIVAIRPVKMALPFAIPESVRLLDPSRPEGASNLNNKPGFTNIDPYTNNPVTTVNAMTNFGWEYVWHCHLLGHEENDMMRPIVFKVATPLAAKNLTATVGGTTPTQVVNLAWLYTQGAVPALQFQIQRATGVAGVFSTIVPNFAVTGASTAGTNSSYTYQDTNVTAGTTYVYRILAVNINALSGPSNSAQVTLATLLSPPTNLRQLSVVKGMAIIAWNAPAVTTGASGYAIFKKTGAGAFTQVATTGSLLTTTYAATGLVTGTTYQFEVRTIGPGGVSNFAGPITITGAY